MRGANWSALGLSALVWMAGGRSLSLGFQAQERTAQDLIQESSRLLPAQPERAAKLLQRALALEPRNPEAHSLLGQIRLDAGQAGEALPHLELAVRLRPDHSPAVFSLGVALLETGRTAESLETFSRLAVREPEEIATRAYLVRATLRLKKTELARTNLAVLRRLASTEALLHAQLVEWCFQEEGGAVTREQAEFTLRLLLRADRQARVRYLLAQIRQRSGETEEAVKELYRALALDDSKEEYFSTLVTFQGSTSIEKVDPEILHRGLDKFPESRDLLITEALWKMHRGQITEAFDTARRVVNRYPSAPEGHVLLGRLELANLEFEKAASAFRRTLELRPTDAAASYYLGLTYRRLGSDAEALKQFEAALAIRPEYPDALLEYGRLLYDLGQYEKAGRAIAGAIRVSPRAPAAYNLMAQTQRKLGKPEEAAKYQARFKELMMKQRP